MKENKRKIFGVGCPRTGTTTLAECLTILGYRNVSWRKYLFQSAIVHGDIRPALEVATQYESFSDLPWCPLYKELDQQFPRSRFVLTVRKDTGTWLRSRLAHPVERGVTLSGDDGSEAPESEAERGSVNWPRDVTHYERHNHDVREYFKARPDDLLEICWENGDGWQQLCDFLGQPIPAQALPHRNKTGPYRKLTAFVRQLLDME